MNYLHTYREMFQSSGKSSYVEHLDGELQFFHLTHEKKKGSRACGKVGSSTCWPRGGVCEQGGHRWSPVILRAGFQAALERVSRS